MVRKVKLLYIVISVCMLLCATCCTVAAADYNTYDGNISSSITPYAEDIIPNVNIKDNYVFFRSGQYTHILVVGELSFTDGVFTLSNSGKQYTITTNSSSSYNNYYTYSVSDINDFTLTVGDKIVYSDLGDFPELEGRSEKYEIINTITICIACLFVVIRSIFRYSSR